MSSSLIFTDIIYTGLRDEGLFRRSPQSSMLRAAQEAYDRGLSCAKLLTYLI